MKNVYLEDFAAESFKPLIDVIIDTTHNELIMSGGRGSTKSSFLGVTLPYAMMEDFFERGEKTHAVVIRKVGNTLSKSVYPKVSWGLNQLGIKNDWHCIKSPLEMTFKETGQKIIFTGCDDPGKLKSITFEDGYCKYLWFEEFDQYDGMEEIRNVVQSIVRGGKSIVIYTFNPPPQFEHWANKENSFDKQGRFKHHSTYLDVPSEWLGETFINMAIGLKQDNLQAYNNEYLGVITGVGGEIFKNVHNVTYTDEDIINLFDYTRQGLDFGMKGDPAAWEKICYDENKKEIHGFDEIYGYGIGTASLSELIKKTKFYDYYNYIKCDSAEPRTVDTMNYEYNINAICCQKGPDSVRHGIEWLADRKRINIDRKRCPWAYWEFSSYAYDKDKNGNWIRKYPDKNNHTIDCYRYSLDDIILQSGWRVKSK